MTEEVPERASNDEDSTMDPISLVKALTRLELDLSCFSEKLVNLDLYITNLSFGGNNLGSLSLENDEFPAEDIHEALIMDLSYTYVIAEVDELQILLDVLQQEILNAGMVISSSLDEEEFSVMLQEKLQCYESSFKNLQDQLLEIKKQIFLLGGSFSFLRPKSSYKSIDQNYAGLKSNVRMTEQQKIVLQMLENSLAREFDLEKKLQELKQTDQEQKLKLFHADQITSSAEAASEVAWERLLEAENAAEVFKGIAKEMMGKLQIAQFSLTSSTQREDELKSKLRVALDELKDTKTLLQRANASIEVSRKELSDLDNVIDDLRGNVFMAESRAEALEAKLATVTETNTDLTEELQFLKTGAESKDEKISLLEKQVRDLEIQLNHAKAASEAGQEQQNMLYTAIWDMETLIEDLKSKVSKAETRAEDAEEQCLVLVETNMELNKEVTDLKSRTESLEEMVNQAQRAKVERVKEIERGAKLITDMALQLAIERERIHKQLGSLARENKVLKEELRRTKEKSSEAKSQSVEDDIKDSVLPTDISANSTGRDTSSEELTEPTCTNNKTADPPNVQGENETEIVSIEAVNSAAAAVPIKYEAAAKVRAGYLSRKYTLLAILALTSSALAVHLSRLGIFSANKAQGGQQ
ncbi:WPP domain-interacting tail-anchored protein 2-like protein [Drosera capensis]